MFSDHSSWFVKYQVVLNAILVLSQISSLGEEEEEEDTFLVLKTPQKIYSFTGKWKISVESLSADTSVLLHAVNWNGAVYWASLYGSLLYFKIDVEQLQTLPLPEGLVSSEIMPMCFKESRGHLHLIVYNDLNVSSILERNSLRLSAYVM
ncbi:hypothetical protein HanIR_Chr16g0833661 [Helianthus annuus]|nr:hypothetical protein HanIR_Chr16g0833661 [Helianthus annuus]